VAGLPELEEETAVANIALDLLGQARMLLARAGGITGQTGDQLLFATWRLDLLQKLSAAPDALWPLAGELLRPDPDALGSVGNSAIDHEAFDAVLDTVLAAAGLDRPTAAPLAPVSGHTGRDGVHTEAMGYILAELQSVARAYPDAT
jgi:ring-1,2-phenylacetyl-CoA epoxidase subunit PaaC